MLPMKQIVKNVSRLLPSVRPMSSNAGPLVDLAVDNEGIATLTLQRLPVNSLNLDMLQDIIKSLDEVDKNKYKGMILTSALPTVFTAGLDIMEMYNPDLKRAEIFWSALHDVWLKLFGSKFITAAAINGHSPAGGCLLALSCEYRAMVNGKYTIGNRKPYIGLNETALGMEMPIFARDSMRHTISAREAEFALTSARLYSVDEALKVGLIDETVTDKAEAVEKCKQFIKKFDTIPPFARAATKLSIREAPLKNLMQNRKQDLERFVRSLQDPKLQETVGLYLESLRKKKAK